MAMKPAKKPAPAKRDLVACFIPGCSVVGRCNEIAFFSMSFGDLPYWWKGTPWVTRHQTALPMNAQICEQHFEERFIDRSRKKPRLFVGTIPTVNVELLHQESEEENKPGVDPLDFICRLCAKKETFPLKGRLDALSNMKEVLVCCLGKFKQQKGMPLGVCEGCVKAITGFGEFVKKCEQSQIQLLQLIRPGEVIRSDDKSSFQPTGSNKENSTTNVTGASPVKYESLLLTSARKQGSSANKRKKTLSRACPDCGKVFQKLGNYNTHLISHTSDKHSLACQICDKKFSQKRDLRFHLEAVHEGKKIECGVCGKVVANQNSLMSHMRVHLKKELKQKEKCPTCGKTFASLNKMKVHLKTHETIDKVNIVENEISSKRQQEDITSEKIREDQSGTI